MRYLALPKEPISMADEILTFAEVALLLKVARHDGLHDGVEVRAAV